MRSSHTALGKFDVGIAATFRVSRMLARQDLSVAGIAAETDYRTRGYAFKVLFNIHIQLDAC